jgi:hypothetical protein
MQNPNSLTVQKLKEKYYPHTSIMGATLGTKLSFAWRSLMSASEVLHHELVWRVGDGIDIHIWGDKWLPTPTNFAIQSPQRLLLEDARVIELIDQDSSWWNLPLIQEIFHEEEAHIICKIPLSLLQSKDVLIWHGTKN